MKKALLFIVLKVVDIAGYIFGVALLNMLLRWIGFLEWLDMMFDKYEIATVSILSVILVLCIIYLIKSKFLKGWIALNKKWVDKILK